MEILLEIVWICVDTSKEYLYGFVWILVRNICVDLFGTLVWNIWFVIHVRNSLFVYVGLGQP